MASKLRSGDPAGALRVLTDSSSVNVRMVNMAFNAAVESGRAIDTAAIETLQTCAKHGLTPTGAIYQNVLMTLDKKSPPEAVIAWLARMRECGAPIDTAACNVQLKAHLRMRDYSAAAALLTSMIRSVSVANGHPQPDEISFNTVISALGQAQKPEKAESILTTMLDAGFTPTLVTFTTVISAHSKASRPADAARVFQKLLATSAILPDAIAFNTMLSAYANAADPDGARKMLAHFEEHSKDECPAARPDLVSYNTMLLACARASRPAEAETAFKALRARGLEPNLVSYSTVLSAHARVGNVAQAQSWLDAMIAAGVAPDAVSYNTVCSAHARRGDHQSALRTFRQMETGGVAVTATTHAIMVNALVQSGDLAGAERSLAALVAAGERLSAASFNSLITAQGRAGRVAKAEATYDSMMAAHVRPSLITFNALASAHAAAADVAAVEHVVQRASERGLKPDRYTYGALLQACIKSAQLGGVDRSAASQRTRAHVGALLASGIPLNDFLRSACVRAVGEGAFSGMLDEHEKKRSHRTLRSGATQSAQPASAGASASSASGGGSWRRQPAWTPALARAAVAEAEEAEEADGAEAAAAADGSGDVVMDAADAVEAAVDEEGWVTKTRNRRKSAREQKKLAPAQVGTVGHSLTSSIKKEVRVTKAPTKALLVDPTPSTDAVMGEDDSKAPRSRRVSTESLSGLPMSRSGSQVRLVVTGVPLTRSKSARARLLQLAQDIVGSVDDLNEITTSVPLRRSVSSVGSFDAAGLCPPIPLPAIPGLPPIPANLPLKRSAHSELALCLEGTGLA